MKDTAHLLPTWPYLARPSAYSAHLMAWLAACGHYYAASARYEELSHDYRTLSSSGGGCTAQP
jgi:hypothetical protein